MSRMLDFTDSGFRPLRKAHSEPVSDLMDRLSLVSLPSGSSFVGSSGYLRTPHNLAARQRELLGGTVEKDPWAPLTKRSSFGHKAREEDRHPPSDTSPFKRLVKRKSMPRGGNPAVVVVDPFSSGAMLASGVVSRGYHCIRVLSEKNSPVASLVSDSVTLEYDATLQYDSSPSVSPSVALDSLVRSISRLPWDVSAVIAGSETAVSLTDRLSKALGLKGNDPSTSRCRRDKHAMGEAVRSRGARAVRQILTSSWEEAAAFAKTWDTFGTPAFKCIVKPNQSAGSDDVFLCESLPDLKAGFDKINDSINAVGALNEGCLVQEFLEGTEYVVDSVSCNGVHKVTCVWEYDKRPINGQFNVYFGMQPLPINTPSLRSLVDYAHTVLDAVGVSDGPSHAEVMMTSTGPCLVEVGARCHGGEGTWKPIADAAVGYNQMEATLDCYLDLEKFRRLPDVPESFKAHGREVFLVTRKAGVVRRLKGFDEIRKMPSYLSEEIMLTLPGFAPLTVDCFSRPASVQLLSLDPQTVEDDYRKIRELEVDGLYDYSIICGTKPSKGAVVVVDPFSSGAQLAARTISLGYHLILVFSTVDSPVASLVQSGTSLTGTVVQHDDGLADADTALGNTLQQVNSIGVPVVAVVPGAETGVLLADELANRLGTRTNNIKLSDARRNKYKMAEVIRSKGLRAVKQTISSDWEQVEDWVDKEDPKPFKVIAKPNQSAGSDDVFCCEDKGELKKGFDKINNSINAIGVKNEGVLVQEFLSGTEYVVDCVSRDGVHKVTAIWEYDKRPANGQFNVYFGMSILAVRNDLEVRLKDYVFGVLDALEVANGPTHSEVKMTETGPCLVETGARCHGGEATWQPLADGCVGHNQINVSLDAYLRPDEYDKVPEVTTELKQYGREVFLVAYEGGTIESMPGIDIVRGLDSFVRMEMAVQPGDDLRPTVDCFTRPGAVQLMHADKEVVMRDYESIRNLEENGFFVLKEKK